MKKMMVCLLVGLFALSAQAASVSWYAFGSSVTEGYNNGTAYLIEVAQGGPTLETMIATIRKSGLDTTNASVTQKSSGSIFYSSDLSQYGAEPDGATFDVSTTATYYVLFVDAKGENFLFTNGLTTSDEAFDYTANGDLITANPEFLEKGEAWASNGGTIGVPEPTVLALLALGVAGLALKRKVA